MNEAPLTLFLSVGGSPQPLATALAEIRPSRVFFIVSDGSDGTPSSETMVTEPEIVFRRDRPEGDPARVGPGLAYAEGCPEHYNCVKVPPDDPGRVLALVDTHVAREMAEGHHVIVDYTGGTKSMTAGLVMAATAHDGVRLQFMLGTRADLRQVTGGSEHATEIPQRLIGFAQVFSEARQFASRFNYAAAAAVLDRASRETDRQEIKPPKAWKKRCIRWRSWLSVLDLWDSFDHRSAKRIWRRDHASGALWAKAFSEAGLGDRLETLAEVAGRPSAVLVEDLWLNAERRAELGQYDDAIARLYRLAEAAVQARLHERFGTNTGRVPLAELSEEMRAKARPKPDFRTGESYVELGLRDSIDHLRHRDPNDALVTRWPGETPMWQRRRNRSILAHGFTALGRKDWEDARDWFCRNRAILWEDLLNRSTAAQLPRDIPRAL